MTELEMYIGQGKWNILYHFGYPSDTTRGECAIFALESLGISKAFARQSYCLYVILKHLQVLASVSKPFARILNAFSRKCKINRNPFALFVMDSQKFARIRKNFASIHEASLFSLFLQASLIIFGEFAANSKFSYSQGYSSRYEIGITYLYSCSSDIMTNCIGHVWLGTLG